MASLLPVADRETLKTGPTIVSSVSGLASSNGATTPGLCGVVDCVRTLLLDLLVPDKARLSDIIEFADTASASKRAPADMTLASAEAVFKV